ncbi:hypothetical protein L518_2824 [Bordetella bronchiseptica MBORD675]|nr:hypothetical protein L518_2824 [Bordetella bronchiseptica MBORD675]
MACVVGFNDGEYFFFPLFPSRRMAGDISDNKGFRSGHEGRSFPAVILRAKLQLSVSTSPEEKMN